jgi:hypothetical protein
MMAMDKDDIEKKILDDRKKITTPKEIQQKTHEMFLRIEKQYDDILALMKQLKSYDEDIGRMFMSATIKAMLVDFSKDTDEMFAILNYCRKELVAMETEFNKNGGNKK